MRLSRVLFVAFLTGVVSCVLAFYVGDYLTTLAHVPDMEGRRGITIVFLCVPLGILVGLVIGIVSAILVRRQGVAGLLIAQSWSLLIVCGLAGLLAGVPYLLSDKPPKIDGKPLELLFELRVPATFKIPDQPDETVRVNLIIDGLESQFAFIDWSSMTKDAEHVTIPGKFLLLTHSKSRSVLASLGSDVAASQFIELKILPAPTKQDEIWSDWIFAKQRADLTPVPELERFALRYRVRPVD